MKKALVEIVLGLYALTFPASVSLSEQAKSEARIQHKIYPKSVDEILEGLGFEPVCTVDYVEKISKGDVVLFVYNTGDGVGERNGMSLNFENQKAMAEVLRIVFSEFPRNSGLKLLKFNADCDPELARNEYDKIAIAPYFVPTTPHIALFRNGVRLTATNLVVPSFEDYVIDKWVKALRYNIEKTFGKGYHRL